MRLKRNGNGNGSSNQRTEKMKAPHTVNQMAPPHSGPPGLLGLPTSTLFNPPPQSNGVKVLGWLSEGTNKVAPEGQGYTSHNSNATDPHAAMTAPVPAAQPNDGETRVPPKMSNAAAMLLKKTAQEKKATYNTVAAAKSQEEQIGDRSDELPQKEMDEAVQRAQNLMKNQAEKEKIRTTATRIRISIKAVKHLPKMDKFGKTDAYCVTTLDNRKAGGQRYKRTTKTIKRNLNPEWTGEVYDFEVKNYIEQSIEIQCWDWDAGSDDQVIGKVVVPLAPLLAETSSEQSHPLSDLEGQVITGHDGSPTVMRVRLERNVAPLDVGLNVNAMVGDAEEERALDCTDPAWDNAVRGLMFDVENHSAFPVLLTGIQAQAGRACTGSCAYTVYRAPGRWNNGRCPCHRLAPFKFLCCCCGRCPSGKEKFGLMKWCCRCTPCGAGRMGCCCWGECGPGLEVAEPCCEGCVPCCTGNCAAPACLLPLAFPLFCCCCGCCTGPRHGGVGEPGLPALSLCRCCGCQCCRNGVHRHSPDCQCRGVPVNLNCSWASCCCFCCRKKPFDRRRWTRVCSQWASLPSDWGALGQAASFRDFERGGVLIPPRQTYALYLHVPHPETAAGDQAIAVRGPFKRGYKQGDVTAKDPFLRLRTGACTDAALPFANSDPHSAERDGQYYNLYRQHLQQYSVCAFVGKLQYRVLDPKAVPCDCVTVCGWCPQCC